MSEVRKYILERMGSCISDLRGGQQAVGGGAQPGAMAAAVSNAAHNDAVSHFFRARGDCPLFTPLEVYFVE